MVREGYCEHDEHGALVCIMKLGTISAYLLRAGRSHYVTERPYKETLTVNQLPESDAAEKPAPSPVDVVIDALGKRLVPPRDVDRLDRAVQGAKAPAGGRAGADEGLGRALGGDRAR